VPRPIHHSGSARWDNTAALYVLSLEHFTTNGAHFEAVIDEETLLGELVTAINAPAAE
jgi:hypothetical protein